MKKRSKLATLLAVTFATSLFSGCVDKSGDLGLNNNMPVSDPSAIELEQSANRTYKERIDKWMQYVSYNEPEDVKELTKSYIDGYASNTNEDVDIYIDREKGLYIKTNTTIHEIEVPVEDETPSGGETGGEGTGSEIPEGEGGATEPPEIVTETVRTATSYEYSIYNSKINKVIFEEAGLVPEYDNEQKPVSADYSKKQEKTIKINLDFIKGIFEVTTKSYNEVVEEPTEEPAEGETLEPVITYEEVITYSYYDYNGTALAENLEAKANKRYANGYQLVDIDEWTYAIFNGEIIKKFPLGKETNIPLYNNATNVNLPTTTGSSISYNSYGYITKGDYNYCITEEQFESVQVSQDFSMTRVPGAVFEITNKNYDIVAKYETEGYAVMGYAILENGNVYICEYDMLQKDAPSYDILTGDVKLNVNHKIIDVATGATTSLDKDYVVQKVYNNVTPEIKTFLNAVTMSEFSGDAKIKEGYILAQVQKFANGAVEQDTTTVVLNENLEIVVELPNVIDNQFGYMGFLEKDVVLLNTRTVENNIIHYTGNVRTGDIELYFHNFNMYSVKKFNGGFIYNKKVYNYNFREIYDLSDYYNIRVNKNLVYFDAETTKYVGWLSSDNSNSYDAYFVIENMGESDAVVVGDCYYKDSNSNIYDAYGERLFSGQQTYETVYEPNDNSKYVEYKVEYINNISKISEGVYLVTQIKEYFVFDKRGYADGDVVTDDKSQHIYYSYYILK